MAPTLYTIRLAGGEIVTGCIQGSGGLIGSGEHNAARVRKQIDLATAGRPLGIAEPERGHAQMWDELEGWRRVDLRGAELLDQAVTP